MSTVFNEQPDVPDLAGDMDLEERHALRRVAGLSTELQDISEVEYRALRLERVVLVGVWAESAKYRGAEDTGAGNMGAGDAGDMDLEERHALRRVAGLSTELQDISEVEYRALRLERVVLVGVWAEAAWPAPRTRCASSADWPRPRGPRCSTP